MATSGPEIASALVALRVKMPGVKEEIDRSLSGANPTKIGERVGAKFSAALKKTIKVGAVAAGAAIATVGVAGFKAAAGIEKSQKVLGGLYDDAELATKTMNDLRKATRTSPIDAAAYDKAAQSLAYAGIQGEDAVGTLKNVGLAITAAGGDSTQLGQATNGIMKAVNNGGIAMMDSLGMISESGVPILSGLAAKFDTTTDQIKKMASSGEISITDVMDVLQNGTGDTFAQMKTAGEQAEKSLSNVWKSSKDAVIDAIGQNMLPLVEKLAPMVDAAGRAVVDFVNGMRTGEGPGGRFVEIMKEIRDAVASGVKWFRENKVIIGQVAAVVGGAVLALKGYLFVTKTLIPGIKAAKGAMVLLNAAFAANPIGIVVTVLGALIAGLIYFFTQTKTGKKVWAAIVEAFKQGWEQIKAGLDWVIDAFATGWQQIKDGFTWLIEAFKLGWEQIKSGYQAVIDAFAQGWGQIKSGFQWLIDAFAVGWEQIKSGFQWVVDAFALGWEQIKAALASVRDFFVNIWNTITNWVSRKIAQAKLIITVGVWAIRQMWTKTWTAIGTFFTNIWNSIVNWVTTKINWVRRIISIATIAIRVGWTAVWNSIKNFFVNLWNTIVNWVSEKIGQVSNIISSGIDYVKNVWSNTWTTIRNVVSNVWGKIKSTVQTMITWIKTKPVEAFEKARDAIGDAWDGIKELAKKPVRFVIDTVINGMIRKINGFLPKKWKLSEVSLPKGFRAGGFTGNAGLNDVAGVVHGREHVIRAESTAKINRNHPGMLDHMNRTGTLPGFRKGGYVTPLPRGSYSVSQPFHSGHNGIDLAAPTGTKTMSAAPGVVTHAGWEPGGSFGGGNQVNVLHAGNILTWYAHLSSIAARVGKQVKAGEVIGRVGSTGNSTGPHLHYMIETGYKGSLGSGNWINPAPYMTGHTKPQGGGGAIEAADGLMGWVEKKLKDAGTGMWGDIGAGMAMSVAENVISFIKSKIPVDIGSAGTPTLYDNGGLLQPGISLVENRSGRPEPILTGGQWDDLLGSRGGAQNVYVQNPFTGEYLLAKVDDRADDRIDLHYENAARTGRLTRMGSV